MLFSMNPLQFAEYFSCSKQLKTQVVIVADFRLPLQSLTHIKVWLPPVSTARGHEVVHRALLCS